MVTLWRESAGCEFVTSHYHAIDPAPGTALLCALPAGLQSAGPRAGGLRAPQTPALYACISVFSTALFFFAAPDLGEGLRTSPKSGALARGHHRRLAYV